MSDTLFYAICAEHKQRTGHDIFAMLPHSTRRYTCDVCGNLSLYYQAMQKAEEEYQEQQYQEYLKTQAVQTSATETNISAEEK